MSDIVINNGKLPPNCWDCKYESYHVPDCPCWNGTAYASDYRQSRYPFCPVKELPPHGDLIDRQKLLELATAPYGNFYGFEALIKDIKNAPTVLEASEERE